MCSCDLRVQAKLRYNGFIPFLTGKLMHKTQHNYYKIEHDLKNTNDACKKLCVKMHGILVLSEWSYYSSSSVISCVFQPWYNFSVFLMFILMVTMAEYVKVDLFQTSN
jgi:hypothetical protein